MKEKVARLIECERILRQTHAEQLRLIAELNVDEFAAVDVSLALQLSPVNAKWLMGRATELVEVFPDALEALDSGVISERSVHGMIDNTVGWRLELAQKAVSKTLDTAAGRCSQQLRRSVLGRLQRADPAEHARRREERRRDRKVTLFDSQDGMGIVSTEQPIEIAQAIYAKVDRIARQEHKNGRTMDAVRADVLAGLVLEEPKSAGLNPLIQATVPITALLGVNDRPGTLAAGQLIPAHVVRELMSHPDTVFHRLLTDPAGQLLEYSPEIYRPKAGVDRFIRTRHRTCVMPCCSHPSRSCDLDHAVAWPEGKTTGTNVGPLDRGHHRYKHATNAEVAIADDGTTTIKTRWGQTYTTRPEPVDEPPS